MNKLLFTIVINLGICSSVLGQCEDRYNNETSPNFILHQNLVYGQNFTSEDNFIDLKLDVLEPSISTNELKPLIIFVHGGSFSSGNKEAGEVRWFCEDLAKRGIVTASINYRLEASLFSLVEREKMIKAVIRAAEDVKAAVRFFHKSIEDGNPYNLDKNQIVLGGVSAGSIAALHAIFMDEFYKLSPNFQDYILELNGDSTLEGNSGNAGYADEVAGIINISGALISPEHLANNTDIPILSIHNSVDLAIPYKWGNPYFIPTLPYVAGSFPIHNRMKTLGGYSELYTVDEINHVPHTLPNGGDQYFAVYNECMRRIAKFMRYVVPCTETVTHNFNEVKSDFEVYPNPVEDKIIIEGIDNLNQFKLELIDLSGKVVVDHLNLENNSISINNYSLSGLYLLRGSNFETNTVFSRKVFINKKNFK